MDTIFTKIIKGDIPSYKVAENEKFYAFLDIQPLKEGHVLVVPILEVDYIFDLEDGLLAEMMVFSKHVAVKIKKVFPCRKVGVTVIGLEVNHAHIHLIPIDSLADMTFTSEKLKLSPSRLEEIAIMLQNA